MKVVARIAIIVGLAPALLKPQTLSSAAQALLRKPETGSAKITLTNSSSEWSEILRVTDQFVSISRGGPLCDNVPMSEIAKVKHGLAPNECCSGPSMWFGLLLSPVLVGILIKEDIDSRAFPYGQWESTPIGADGRVHRLRLEYRSKEDGWPPVVWGQDAVVRKGRYRFEDGNLTVHYDDGTDGQLGAVRFACDRLVTGGRFQAEPIKQDRAYAPIVGRWVEEAGSAIWDLRPDGTCQIEKVTASYEGTYSKKSRDLPITWESKPPDGGAWQIQPSRDRLVVTSGGARTEYQRTPNFPDFFR